MRVIRGGSELPSHDATGFVEQPLAVLRVPHVAALNLSPEPGDVEGNLQLAERAVTEAKRAHPDLEWVVLPELFTTAYSGLASVHRHAESAERGPSARFFAALARELGLHVAYGFPERLPGGGVSDSANLVGPGGVLLTYRKRHLVRATGEDLVFVPGTELPVVEAGGTRVALVVCWDLGFPQTVREAALAGARLILSPPDGGIRGGRSTTSRAPPVRWTTPSIWRAPTSSAPTPGRPSTPRAASTARTGPASRCVATAPTACSASPAWIRSSRSAGDAPMGALSAKRTPQSSPRAPVRRQKVSRRRTRA